MRRPAGRPADCRRWPPPRCRRWRTRPCIPDRHTANINVPPVGMASAANAAGQREEQRGDRHGAHLPPAVERMQQTHRLVLMLGRAGVHNRGDHDLDQAAADRVQHDGGHQRRIRVGHARGQQPEREQPRRGGHMRGDDAGSVADAVHIPAGQHVHDELGDEVHRDQRGQLRHVDAEGGRERDEQQRHEVVDHGLRDVAVEAGDDGAVVVRRSCGHAETLLRVGAGRSDAVIVSMSLLRRADFRTSCPYGVFGGGAARVVGEEP